MPDLKQYGGEGKEKYKKTVSDSSLKQHGGEGSTVSKGSDSSLLNPTSSKNYCGPGRYLKTSGD